MSNSRRLDSLKHYCVQNIARHFEKCWFKPFEEQFGSAGKLLHIIGPFDDITSDLNQYLLDVLIKEKLMKTRYLQLLITYRLVELDLSQASGYVYNDSIVSTIADRCHKLTKLNLSNCNKISSRALENAVSQLPLIQILIFKSTKCDDKVLHAISQYNNDLRHLDVTRCKITDRGLTFLCSNKGNLPCPKLQTLRIRDCDIYKPSLSVTCVLTFMLQRTKNFDLDFNKLHLVLAEIHKINNMPLIVNSNLQYTRVQCLDFGTEDVVNADIELVCKYCPNITAVSLNPAVSNTQINILNTLVHLRHVEIVLDTHSEVDVTFDKGILPLLSCVGQHLQVLLLFELTDVCLFTIGKYCPQLKNLNLMVSTLQNNRSQNQEHFTCFSELQNFKCVLTGDNDMLSEDSLSVVLNNADNLQVLSLNNIQFLATQELGHYLNHNIKPNLEQIEIIKCDEISGSVFLHLLTVAHCLTSLTLNICRKITRADYSKMMKYSEKYLPRLKVEWT